jgi:hypothetical protein
MKRGLRFMFVGVIPLVSSTTVFAQATDPTEAAAPAPSAPAPAGPLQGGPQVASAALPAGDPVTTIGAVAEPAASRYPRDVMSRPLTYPAGLGAVGFDLSSTTSNPADPATVRLLGGYGITDDFELNFGHYAFPTNDAGKGTFDFGLGYKLVRGAVDGKLEIIGRVQTGYSLAASGFNPLLVGLHAQYNFTPTFAVLTPGGQLSAGLAGDSKPVTFGLPVSLALQPTKTVYVQLDTTLATFKIANASNTFLFSDATPVAFTAYVNALPQIDLFAGISANLTPADTMAADGSAVKTNIADTMGVIVGARYYLGKL